MSKLCKDKTFDDIRDNINEWYFDKLWMNYPLIPGGWFESTGSILTTAFGRICENGRPSGLGLPARLQGTTAAVLIGETGPTLAEILKWTQTAEAYAACVHTKIAATCRRGPMLSALKASGRALAAHSMPLPVNPDERALCRYYSKWAKRFHRWTVAFADWEQPVVDCLTANGASVNVLQISPVPWPPWADLDESDAT